MNKPRLPLDIEFLMESILSENPDGIMANDDWLTDWRDKDARAFMIFDNFSVLTTDKHYEIIQRFVELVKLKEYPHNGREFKVSSTPGMYKELKDGKLGKYVQHRVKKHPENWPDKEVEIYRTKLGLSGRLWMDKKIISFWNSSKDVIKNWDKVERLFSEFSELGNIDEYRVDFIERSTNPNAPMVSAKEVGSSRKSNATNSGKNFIEKLDPAQLRLLQRKIHTLPPQKKRMALMALGANNYKAADIAAKVGMSVAEFNHIMLVNERDESKMPNLIDLAKQLGKQ